MGLYLVKLLSYSIGWKQAKWKKKA